MVFSRATVRSAVAALAAVAALGLSAGTRVPPAGPTDFESIQTPATTRVVIPDSFDLPGGDSDLQLTTVVTTDFDSDGDLDVVASDGATHLFVWINDGAGHLTRKEPAPQSDRQPFTSTPSVAERPSTALISIQPAGAVALSNDQRVWISLAGCVFRRRARPHVVSIAPGSLGSRAPPLRPFVV